MPARWRPLWLPPTLPVSSLTHTVGVAGAEIERERGERRDREAGGDLAGQRDQRRLGHPVGAGERPPRHPRPVGDERVGIVEPVGPASSGPVSGWRTW